MKTMFTPAQALNLIQSGVQSGSIKLVGPADVHGNSTKTEVATQNASADAAYLLQLVRKLTTDEQQP